MCLILCNICYFLSHNHYCVGLQFELCSKVSCVSFCSHTIHSCSHTKDTKEIPWSAARFLLAPMFWALRQSLAWLDRFYISFLLTDWFMFIFIYKTNCLNPFHPYLLSFIKEMCFVKNTFSTWIGPFIWLPSIKNALNINGQKVCDTVYFCLQ